MKKVICIGAILGIFLTTPIVAAQQIISYYDTSQYLTNPDFTYPNTDFGFPYQIIFPISSFTRSPMFPIETSLISPFVGDILNFNPVSPFMPFTDNIFTNYSFSQIDIPFGLKYGGLSWPSDTYLNLANTYQGFSYDNFYLYIPSTFGMFQGLNILRMIIDWGSKLNLEPFFFSQVTSQPIEYTKRWEKYSNNPIISYGEDVEGIIWNDPSVIKEGDIYRMWLSGGTGLGINNLLLYQASSSDGLVWDIDSTPVLAPGSKGEWDDEKIETPMVIKVNSTYHLYYSGYKTGDGAGQYQIGHATSPDGINWTKDPNNPVIPYTEDPHHWGFYQTAEPGAVYNPNNNTIYLYYVTGKLRMAYDGENSNLALIQGICLATSQGNDGSNFTHYDCNIDGFRDAVLIQSSNYPTESDYVGYSTPFVFIDSNGLFHLFYGVAVYPEDGDWQQVALAHSTSSNGTSFSEIEHDIFIRGSEEWTKTEVRSPCVVEEGEILKMWYAGHTNWFGSSGIGFATYGAD